MTAPRPVLPKAARWLCIASAILAGGCAAPGGADEANAKAIATARPRSDAARQEADRRALSKPLGHFFRDLERLETGQVNQIRILQLGDSHTAGDFFSGYLRSQFQNRFGEAGRGMMPPGIPFDGLRQNEVSITQSGPWAVRNSLSAPDKGPYGLTGFVAISASPGARMSMSPIASAGFDSASIDYIANPYGGEFEIRIDGALAKVVSTVGAAGQPIHLAFPVTPGAQTVEIVARASGVAISGWAVQTHRHGVFLDSFGVVGSTIGVFSHWDPNIVQNELQTLAPSLIILSYGTNEGFQNDFDAAAYARNYADAVAMLRRGAPDASILIVAPPDGQRKDGVCRPPRKRAKPVCRWITPAALRTVRSTQRDLAGSENLGFWDWSNVVTPDGGIDRWTKTTPPLARPDHVHFTIPGYERAADALFNVLMGGYADFKRDEMAPEPPAARTKRR